MPSFNCDGCGDVIKKPKLDSHSSRCRASMTCLDCSTTFPNPASWKNHTSCITEAEKFEKSVYKPPKDKQKKAADVSAATITPVPEASLTASKSNGNPPQSSIPATQNSEKPTKKSKKTKAETKSKEHEPSSQDGPNTISVENMSKPSEPAIEDQDPKKKEKKKRKRGQEAVLEEVKPVETKGDPAQESSKKKKKQKKHSQPTADEGKPPAPVSSDMPMDEDAKPNDHTPFVITMSQVSSAAKGLIIAAQGAPISIRELIDSVTSFIQSQQTRPCDIVLREDIARMLCDGAVKFFLPKQTGSAEVIALKWE